MVASPVSTTEYTSFDILGRVTASKQTTDGVTYGNGSTDSAMTYTYNLGGAMIEQQYPSGRVVKNTLDASGDLSLVTSKENSSAIFKTYVNDFTYNAAGAVSSLKLGNGSFETTTFNARLQPTQIGLGTSETAQNILKLEYGYGTNANNGNVLSQTITVPTVGGNTGFSAVQTYTYDELNRLKSATENVTPIGGSQSQSWKQTYTFDRYGNRRFDFSGGNTTSPASNCTEAICNPTLSTTNNRLTSTGYLYDDAGNTTRDAEYRTFTYDGENKQTLVKNSSNATIGEYFFDGDGKRVKKYVPATGETTIFVYDAGGKQIAEYSTVVASANDAKVAYLTNDHLGSPRINTDVAGTVTARHDYHPFGEEIATSQRTSGLGYAADTVRKQFTGYERDGETDLDFAQARYMASTLGRFSSPDPQKIVVDVQLEKDSDKAKRLLENYLSKPGQWNRYVYAINNPLKYTDPDGREIRLSKDLTEAERNQILYYLSRNTRDKLNWKTDKDGNIVVTVTEVKGGGQNDGTRLIRRLSKYEKVTTIRLGAGGNATGVDNDTNASNGVGSDSTVTFNPNSNPLITTLDPKTGNGRDQIRPSHIGLIHELIHADHAARGTILTGDASYLYRDSNGTIQAQSYRREEFSTVGLGGLNNKMDITENNIRREQGLNLRAAY